MSASPTMPTPMGPAFPTAKALGKRKAVDTGFDGDHSTAQTSAQTDSRPVKRSRVSTQPARVATTVDPHVGITQQTGTAALTHLHEYSKASGHGAQHPANQTFEIIHEAGAGPSKALQKTRSRVRKQKVVPPDFVPLWKQDLTPEQVEEAARKMDNRELIDNLTEKVDAIVPEQGDKNGKRCMCRWPGCAGSAKRDAETGRHIRDIHLGLGPSCPECGRGFRSMTEVNRHVGKAQCNPADKEAEVKVKPRLRRNRRQ
ncbi:hypothetical protein EWM64_g9100 [Hericium alpestre]|uniref:C2H2-type domain-containing protein n=1 Tax=Hericium alpestre TaxID=135208 RepID=A0A4Y9ZNA7_9AGAM|nr:hypothetical protein EWM64_g9100 [Hericium alpestre]